MKKQSAALNSIICSLFTPHFSLVKRTIPIFFLLSVFFSSTGYATSEALTPVEGEKSIVEKVTSWYMDNMNYGTITLLMTIESSFIPFPSEVVVPPAAYKACQEGSNLNIVWVVLFATIGALLGAIINYYLALLLGRPVIHRFAESRIGRMCLLSSEKVKKAEDYFVKHGKISTLIGRLIPAVRQLISVPAGLAKMNFGSFILFTFLGASAWNIILALLGYIAHGNADLVNRYNKELSYALSGLTILFALYLIYNAFFKKRPEK
jgi:membrane protein DedA with SNARE-associated domain